MNTLSPSQEQMKTKVMLFYVALIVGLGLVGYYMSKKQSSSMGSNEAYNHAMKSTLLGAGLGIIISAILWTYWGKKMVYSS